MHDLGGLAFVLLFLAFTATLAASLAAGAVAWLLQRRGRAAAARTAARWSVGLGVAAPVCLLLAGVVLVRLSR